MQYMRNVGVVLSCVSTLLQTPMSSIPSIDMIDAGFCSTFRAASLAEEAQVFSWDALSFVL